ncbi:tyrosine-type recombinase/integrase [Clostridium thermobutyricum]|uniref:Tyrosine recombinase XerD n=1 Tax=Clostridium thermobutyricum DSM 4928 TaxID=1121339 RepID=A0A1V4SWW0_9CLOT|nr:tyrosine-type recombinase/integrase [Clostridium thermobutyricum]OPX47912.1 tyrosine recombinase XerD [Clostridium thermobutyricum DSM 4928]
MNDKLGKFIESEIENDLDIKTVQKYESIIKDFINYLYNIGEDLEDPKNIKKNFKSYISSLENKNYKPSTINLKITVINKFLRFINIDYSMKYLKQQKKLYISNVISESDYRRMLDVVTDKRDRAIIILLANTGLRVSEALSLTTDIIKDDVILVKGKKGKYREVFLSYRLKEILKDYIENYRIKSSRNKLFTGRKGALKRQSINKILLKYAKKARIRKDKAHPHALRHLFGKRLADKGISLDVIATYLGHEDIKTTVIYTKRNRNELINVLDENFI